MKDIISHNYHFTQLLTLSRGYMTSRIFLTALELGIFEQIGIKKLTSSQVAEKLNTDERATEILLNALASMDLMEKNCKLFSNIKEVANFLIPDSPNYQGGIFGHTASLWEAWSNLTEIVSTGHPYKGEWTEEKRQNLALAMKHHAEAKADKLARLLNCSDVNRILDLGGGPGSHAIAFAKSYPHLKVMVFDRDNQAHKIAQEEIASEDLQDRIKLKQGDLFVDDIGSDYDLVLLSSIICLFGEKENTFLLRKVKESLNDGGRVVILDLILDESKTKPTSAAIFAVNMLVTTKSGRSYTSLEIKGLLHTLGFKDIHRLPMDNYQVVIGKK